MPKSINDQKLPQQTRIVVDFACADAIDRSNNSTSHGNDDDDEDNDWDLLSDRISSGSNQNISLKPRSINKTDPSASSWFIGGGTTAGGTAAEGAIFVPKSSGSVRSINTCDFDNENSSHNKSSNSNKLPRHHHNGSHGGSGSHRTGHSSYKIHRTHSNSTIDSNDDNHALLLGPSGKGVLGVDYVEHVILPTDTLQGICIAYKISTTRLRQANHFSGHSLLLAPKKLVIPISKKALKSGFIRVQDTDAKEYKLYSFLAEFPKLNITEAKAYLELSDWDLKGAIQSAKEDVEWERSDDMESTAAVTGKAADGTSSSSSSCFLKSGQIRFTAAAKGGYLLEAQGAGIRSPPLPPSQAAASQSQQQLPQQPQHSKPVSQQPQEQRSHTPLPRKPSSFASPIATFIRRTTSRIVSPIMSYDDDDDLNDGIVANDLKDQSSRNEHSSSINNSRSSVKAATAAAGIVYSPIPAICSKSVQPQDLYKAAPQHDNYGVELKSVSLTTTSPNSHPLKRS